MILQFTVNSSTYNCICYQFLLFNYVGSNPENLAQSSIENTMIHSLRSIVDGLEKENIGNNSNSPMRTERDNGRAARELKVIFKTTYVPFI